MSTQSNRPRSEQWAAENDATKLRLVINELDEFDARIETLNTGMRTRLNWLLVSFVGVLLGVLGNLIVLLNTR